MEPYPSEIEAGMRRLYHSLNEKNRRRFAGWEALRFGPGGRSYIARLLGCSRNTVSKGAREVSDLPQRGDTSRHTYRQGNALYVCVWIFAGCLYKKALVSSPGLLHTADLIFISA